jgi:predicted nucleic acid-binding protein
MTKRRPSLVVGSILELIEFHSNMVEPVSFAKAVCSDPDDDKFLEAAVAADADYVVSGDAALLRIRKYQRVQIVKPAQFLKMLSGDKSRRGTRNCSAPGTWLSPRP